MKSILSAVIGATLALSAIQAGAQATPGERQVSLTIEADTLASALDKWAQQSGFQIFVQDWEAAKSLRAPSLNGTFAAQDALEQLLSGTALTYVWIDSKTVSIRKRTAKTVPTALQRTSLDAQQGIPVAKFSGDDVSGMQEGNHAGGGTGPRQASAVGGTDIQELEQILVTGTHIRGSGPIGSNVTAFTRDQIERSGYATPQDILQLVPQNFGAVGPELQGGEGNFNRGTGANLRGLGSGATLTLVNGRRQPASGLGDFVDLDSIPAAAIDRIEFLTDGASAIYGSDAIGGVVNIVLRDSYEGAQTSGRFATAGGDSDEIVASQVFGVNLGGWNSMLGYQYYHRSALARADRSFAASSDQRPDGGSDFRGNLSNPGNIMDPATFLPAFAIPQGQDGTQLTPSQLLPGAVNQREPGEGADMLPENTTHAVFLSISKQLNDTVDLFADARWGQRELEVRSNAVATTLFVPSSNPFYVDAFGTGEPLFVNYSLIDDLGPTVTTGETTVWAATVGSNVALGSNWSLAITATQGREKQRSENDGVDFAALFTALGDSDPATAFNPFGDGSHTSAQTLDAIRAQQLNTTESKLREFSVLAEGSLFSRAAGDVRAAIGADYREEDLDTFASFLDTRTEFAGDRHVTGVFGEVTVPLFGGRPGDFDRPRADLSLAGRYEEYSDFGNTFNPKIGLRFRPLAGLALRGTWGTSFRAPRLVDMNQPPKSLIDTLPDPQSPSGFSTVLVRYSGADLKEETATSWTAGVDWQPVESGPTVSLTYYDIDYTDRIITPGPIAYQLILLEEQPWAQVVQRNPSAAELAPLCAQAAAGGYDCAATPPTVIFDGRMRNIAALRTSGIDMSVEHEVDTDIGSFNFGLAANYVLAFEQQLTATSEPVRLLNTAGNPIDLRLRATGGWRSGPIGVDLAVNFADSYWSASSPSRRSVESLTTLDVGFVWNIEQDNLTSGSTNLALRVVNVFDTDPPFLDFPTGMDERNATPLGRLISVQALKKW